MNVDIESFVGQCKTCARHGLNNQREPLINTEIPSLPWQYVAVDLFEWEKAQFHITVDYYIRYFEFDRLQNQTSTTIIGKLKNHFARFGIPQKMTSDNGAQLFSRKFN
ncbi:uncharacterized protein LOC136039102 [Artemia franciscana]|uniref:uncharacterized protein LOC136039102 n=1 Tax=Artemia franciscana TaxID=6661 RepID=UPI0032D9D9E8